MVSGGGSQAAQIALVYEIYTVTRSGLWVLGALFGAISLGGLLGPVSGLIADHFERRRVMVVSELTAGAMYLAMVFIHRPGLLLAGALAATALGSPFRAASGAAIPNLVSADDLAWANAQLGAAFNVALVAGPLVGGALVALSGAGLVFAVNAATFAASGVLIASTSGSFGERARQSNVEGQRARDLFAGFRFVASSRRLARWPWPALSPSHPSAPLWSSTRPCPGTSTPVPSVTGCSPRCGGREPWPAPWWPVGS
jgi:MFS family permease